MAAPPTIMGHTAIKNDTENIINAYVLPTWLINETTNQSLYRGVDAHLHLDALSSLYKSNQIKSNQVLFSHTLYIYVHFITSDVTEEIL